VSYRFNERLFAAGSTGSGKSELINLLFSRVRCQRVLVDTKPEFWIPDVEPTRSIAELDWRQPVIHYQDATGDLDEYDELFCQALGRRNVVVCCHELADLCDDQPNRTPKYVRAYIRKGNIRGCGLLGASLRPVGMPRVSRTEAQHVIVFNPRVDEDDRKVLAKMTERPLADLDAALERAYQLGDEHSFAWFDRPGRTLRVSGPLPDHIRAQIIVQRAVDLNRPARRATNGSEGGPHDETQTASADRPAA